VGESLLAEVGGHCVLREAGLLAQLRQGPPAASRTGGRALCRVPSL